MTNVKGNLKEFEKYAIIGMYKEGIDTSEMKRILNRSSKTEIIDRFLSKYIEEESKKQAAQEKSDRLNKVTKASKTIKETDSKDYNVTYDHKAVLRKMGAAGIHGEDAIRLINQALPKFKNRKAEVNEIYNEAMSKVGARELMIRDSQAGDRGVAVMTEAASGRGESIRRKVREYEPDYVFHVKTNTKK